MQEKGLDDVLDGVARFGEGGGDGFNADGPAAEMFRNQTKIAPIERIEAERVDFETLQRLVGDIAGDVRRPLDGRDVAHAPEEPSRDPRRAARAPCDLHRPILGDGRNSRREICRG